MLRKKMVEEILGYPYHVKIVFALGYYCSTTSDHLLRGCIKLLPSEQLWRKVKKGKEFSFPLLCIEVCIEVLLNEKTKLQICIYDLIDHIVQLNQNCRNMANEPITHYYF